MGQRNIILHGIYASVWPSILCECGFGVCFFSLLFRLSIRFVSHQFPEFNFYLFHICSAQRTSFADASHFFEGVIFLIHVFSSLQFYIVSIWPGFPPSRSGPFVVMHFVVAFFFIFFHLVSNFCHISCRFPCNIALAHSMAERMRWRCTFSFKLFHFNMISLFPKRIIHLYMNLEEEKCAQHTHKMNIFHWHWHSHIQSMEIVCNKFISTVLVIAMQAANAQ